MLIGIYKRWQPIVLTCNQHFFNKVFLIRIGQATLFTPPRQRFLPIIQGVFNYL